MGETYMKMLWLAAIAVCPVLWLNIAVAAPVKVEGGLVEGIVAENLTVYKGIPFAAPPDVAPPLPENPVSRPGDRWLCGNRRNQHRILCGDATKPESVARLLGDRKPFLMVTDPPYGIELDSEWRDRAGLNGCGSAEASYMKHRTEGHTETTISGDTRADSCATG
jgi:hypothetical protein